MHNSLSRPVRRPEHLGFSDLRVHFSLTQSGVNLGVGVEKALNPNRQVHKPDTAIATCPSNSSQNGSSR